MAERGIKVGSAGTQYGNVSGNINLRSPKQPDFARLASSLGVAFGQAKEGASEEAEREAMLALEEVKARTVGMKPDERWAEMQKTRGTLGAGRGFFDKLLVDEDEVTKAWDKASARVKAIDGKRGAERLRAELEAQGQSYDQIQQALTKYHQDKMEDLKAVSETQFIEYGREVEPHILALDTDMFKKEQARVQSAKISTADAEMNRMLHSALQEEAGIGVSEISDVDSPDALDAVQLSYRNDDGNVRSEIITKLRRSIDSSVANAKQLGLDKTKRRAKGAQELFDLASTYKDPELYKELMTTPVNGVVPAKVYPEEYAKNMATLRKTALDFRTSMTIDAKNTNKAKNDELYSSITQDTADVTLAYTANPSEETKKDLDDTIAKWEEAFNTKVTNGDYRYDQATRRQMTAQIRYLKSFRQTDVPDEAITAEAVRRMRGGEGVPIISKEWLSVNGSRLSPDVRARASKMANQIERDANALANEKARAKVQAEHAMAGSAVTRFSAGLRYIAKTGVGAMNELAISEMQKDLSEMGKVILDEEIASAYSDLGEGETINGTKIKKIVNDRILKEVLKNYETLHKQAQEASKQAQEASKLTGGTPMQDVSTGVSAPKGNKLAGVGTQWSALDEEQAEGLRQALENNNGNIRLAIRDTGARTRVDQMDTLFKYIISQEPKSKEEIDEYVSDLGSQLYANNPKLMGGLANGLYEYFDIDTKKAEEKKVSRTRSKRGKLDGKVR